MQRSTSTTQNKTHNNTIMEHIPDKLCHTLCSCGCKIETSPKMHNKIEKHPEKVVPIIFCDSNKLAQQVNKTSRLHGFDEKDAKELQNIIKEEMFN